MDALEQEYATKYAAYEQLIRQGDPTTLPQVQQLNAELSGILSSMLTELGQVQTSAGLIGSYRDDLNAKLIGIQNDYNAIKSSADQLQTLQNIRQHQDAKIDNAFFWYSISLAIAGCVFFLLYIYKLAARPATIPSATTMPTFTNNGV